MDVSQEDGSFKRLSGGKPRPYHSLEIPKLSVALSFMGDGSFKLPFVIY